MDTLESGIRHARAGAVCMATLDGDHISSWRHHGGSATGSQLIGRVRRLKELGEEPSRQSCESCGGRERTQVALQASRRLSPCGGRRPQRAMPAEAAAPGDGNAAGCGCEEALSDLQLELKLSGEGGADLEDIDSALAASAERQKELESEVARLTEPPLAASAGGRVLQTERGRFGPSDAAVDFIRRAISGKGANDSNVWPGFRLSSPPPARSGAPESEVAEGAAAVAAARYEEDAKLDHALAARAEATQAAATAEREVRSARRAESSLAEKLREASVEEARRAAEFESARERLEDAYDMDVQAALKRPPSALNRDDMCERIDALRAEMEAMGPINHTAPEEAAALGERYQFLTAQLQDLEEAQESLIQVIRECDRACTEQFHATFTAQGGVQRHIH